MSSVNIVKRQRQKSKDFFVYYNEWTGEIQSTGTAERTDTRLPFIKTSDKVVERIIHGRANHKHYIVSFDDNNDFRVIKKDNVLRLCKQEDSLFMLPGWRLDKWDIRVKFYTVNNKMTVELNPDSIRVLTNMNLRAELKIEEKRNLNLFVIRKNQPEYLIETFEIDPADLLDHDTLSIDISSLVKHVSYDDIGVLTRRNFENYYFEVINNKYVPKPTGTNRVKSDILQRALDYDDSHIAFEQIEDRLMVSSQLLPQQFDDLGLHHRTQTFYIVGNTPDEVFTQIDLDTIKLRQGHVEHFEIDFSVDDINIIHNNERLRVAKRKIL